MRFRFGFRVCSMVLGLGFDLSSWLVRGMRFEAEVGVGMRVGETDSVLPQFPVYVFLGSE